MGTAAHEEVSPEPPARDPRAELAVLIDQAGGLLDRLIREPGNDRVVSELTYFGVRLGEASRALEADAGRADIKDAWVAMGRALERQAIAGERKAPKGHRAPARHFGLRVVQGIAIAGVALKPLGSFAKHPVQHLAAASLPVKVTAAGVVVGTAAVGAVAIPQVPAVVHSMLGGTGTAGAPSDGTYSASPVTGSSPSQRLIAAVVTKPTTTAAKAGKLAASSSLTPSVPVLVLPSAPDPSASGSPASWPTQDAPSGPSSPAGPATLSVSLDGSPDLSVAPLVTVTISASGGGWAAWHVSKGGSDLDFSATKGVLEAGESATITVTADAVQDGAAVQTFAVAGTQFTITLPVPVPTVTPTDVLPTDLPTVVPTGP